MPDVTGVAHIELTVRDADRSASWYEQVLGMQRLELPEEYRNDSVPAREVNLIHPTAGLVLSLIQHEFGEAGDFSELRVGLDHLALAVESHSELEKWVAHFDGHGVPHSAISDQPWGSVLVFRDPDNIQLELYSAPV
jgi:glyoxylase I family protein